MVWHCGHPGPLPLPGYLKLDLPVAGWQAIARFRLSSHNLKVHTLRWVGVPFPKRTCARCGQESGRAVDNEPHLLFECQATHHIRQDPRFADLTVHNLGNCPRALFSKPNNQLVSQFVFECCTTTVPDAGTTVLDTVVNVS